jgi:hypothetical protein
VLPPAEHFNRSALNRLEACEVDCGSTEPHRLHAIAQNLTLDFPDGKLEHGSQHTFNIALM